MAAQAASALLLVVAWATVAAGSPLTLRLAGSSAVHPITQAWADHLNGTYASIEHVGRVSNEGARRVCLARTETEHVEIGSMSRDWKALEAERLDDDYTFQCKDASHVRVTQLEVAVDGLALVVKRQGAAHECLGMRRRFGLTLAELRWIYTNWSDDDLQHLPDGGVNLASVAPNDDHDGVKEWSDLFAGCEHRPIGPYGAAVNSGPHDFFGEAVFCTHCFLGAAGHLRETFRACEEAQSDPTGCFNSSEDDDALRDWIMGDTVGVAFLSFAYVERSLGLALVPIVSDRIRGVQDTQDAFIVPTYETLKDFSYSVFRRTLYVNVDNEAWDAAHELFEHGFSPEGQQQVHDLGYIPINADRNAKMQQRVDQRGNRQADLVPVKPDSCDPGLRLNETAKPNEFGTLKTFYECLPCQSGRRKQDFAAAQCTACAEGSYAAAEGQTECSPCKHGQTAPKEAKACVNCSINTYSDSDVGMGACLYCSTGKFTSGEGSSSCLNCPKGRYKNHTGGEGECEPCPSRMDSDPGAQRDSECGCAEGFYLPVGGWLRDPPGPCLPCPDGMICEFKAMETLSRNSATPYIYPLVDAGYMTRPWRDPMRVFKCISPKHCPGQSRGEEGMCGRYRDADSVACGACVRGAYEGEVECEQCGGNSALPAVLTCLAAAGGVVAMTLVVNQKAIMRTHAQILSIAVVGLLLTGMQTLSVFQQLHFAWFQPMATLFRILSVISFDIKLLKIGCLVQDDPSMIFRYVMRQSIAPCSLPVILLCLLVNKRYFQPDINVRVDFVNTVGALYQVFFISTLISGFTPLVCYEHPGKSGSSVVSVPSVLCFAGGPHGSLVAIGMLGLLATPLPFLALSVYGTLKYPSFVRGNSNALASLELQSFRFMFFRFKPTQYYYSLVQLSRNLLLCLVPVVIRTDLALQICIMAVIIGTFILVQKELQPWRSKAIDIIDGILNMLLLLVLLAGALYCDVTTNMDSVEVLATVSMVAFAVVVLGTLAVGTYLRFRPTPFYHMFICHHKAAAAAQARLLKILLQRETGHLVFIDSDDLTELDTLFDVVKRSVGNLVVYLTQDTLRRPWCAGEIATGFRCGSKVTAVRTPSFLPPLEQDLDGIEDYLDLTSTTLSQYGITFRDVAESYRHLCSPGTPCVNLRRDVRGQRRFELLAKEVASGRGAAEEPAELPRPPVPARPGMLVLSVDVRSDEAVASASILVHNIQEEFFRITAAQICCLADYCESREQIARAMHQARAGVVVLSADSLDSLPQLTAILELMATVTRNSCSAGGRGGPREPPTAAVIPLTIPGFAFPTEEYYQEKLPKLWPDDSDIAESLMRAFFRHIAVIFPNDASEQVIGIQAQAVLARTPKVCFSTRSNSPQEALGMPGAFFAWTHTWSGRRTDAAGSPRASTRRSPRSCFGQPPEPLLPVPFGNRDADVSAPAVAVEASATSTPMSMLSLQRSIEAPAAAPGATAAWAAATQSPERGETGDSSPRAGRCSPSRTRDKVKTEVASTQEDASSSRASEVGDKASQDLSGSVGKGCKFTTREGSPVIRLS